MGVSWTASCWIVGVRQNAEELVAAPPLGQVAATRWLDEADSIHEVKRAHRHLGACTRLTRSRRTSRSLVGGGGQQVLARAPRRLALPRSSPDRPPALSDECVRPTTEHVGSGTPSVGESAVGDPIQRYADEGLGREEPWQVVASDRD